MIPGASRAYTTKTKDRSRTHPATGRQTGRRTGRRTGRTLAALTLACAGASTALAGTASAATSPAPATAAVLRAPSCRDITFTGDAGRINVRTGPSHTIAWGIYMHDPSADTGPWDVDVLIDGNRVDHKGGPRQTYPPHASLPASRYRGRTFSLRALHTDLKGPVYHEIPNGCIIP